MADWLTPVAACMLLRKRFARIVLLESNDFHYRDNSRSYICCDPLISIRVRDCRYRRISGVHVDEQYVEQDEILPLLKSDFDQIAIEGNGDDRDGSGFFGHFAFESARYFDRIRLVTPHSEMQEDEVRLDFYRYVLIFDHVRNSLQVIQHCSDGESDTLDVLMADLHVPLPATFPFSATDIPVSPLRDEQFEEMVESGVRECHLGNVFQIVLSRPYVRPCSGDDLNVYRHLRTINPSPYLFYFDYGDYRLFGSSPETQLILDDGVAEIRPIAGTYRRTGDDAQDRMHAVKLAEDQKEQAEHVMLVDLARNDLNRICDNVRVESFREIQYLSHVIHLVSRVCGEVRSGVHPLDAFARTFPAGTLSGAPKIMAIGKIAEMENTCRGFYGGALGYFGIDGTINTAILIRSIRSCSGELQYRAGAGVVADSKPSSERMEVEHKLAALEEAIDRASQNTV